MLSLIINLQCVCRHLSPLPLTHRQVTTHFRPLQQDLSSASRQSTLVNGSPSPPLYRVPDTNTNPFLTSEDTVAETRPGHASRYATFHNAASSSVIHQRDNSFPYTQQRSPYKLCTYGQSLNASERNTSSPPNSSVRAFSPCRTYQVNIYVKLFNLNLYRFGLSWICEYLEHLLQGTVQNAISQYNYLQEMDNRYSPKRLVDCNKETTSPYFQRRYDNRYNMHGNSSTPPRTHPQTNRDQVYNSTSPVVLQRFCHLSKGQDEEDVQEEPGEIPLFNMMNVSVIFSKRQE